MFLRDLLILLIFVWLSRKLFQAIKLPALFGEVFAGVIAGPLIFGLVQETEAIKILAELGIFFLMFHSGLEANPKDLIKASKSAILVAVLCMSFAILGGVLVSSFFGYDITQSLFVGITLAVTAVAILTRLLKDSKLLGTKVANISMTAAITTEVVVLILFSIFLDIHKTGSIDIMKISIDLLKFVAYFVAVFYIGHHYFKYLYKILYKGNKGFTFSVILALTFSVIAELIGLHFIIGAFLAGLFLHQEIFEKSVFDKIEDRVFGISYSFLAPIFFATLAFHLDFTALKTAPLFIISLIITGFASKILGSKIALYKQKIKKIEKCGIGFAMNSRGAVDMILATIGLQAGIINKEIFSVLVLSSFAITLISIIAMKPVSKKI